MNTKKYLIFLLVTVTAVTSINPLMGHPIREVTQLKKYIVNGQEISVHIRNDLDGSTLILDGNGQALILDSIDFIENDDIQHPLKSIKIINAPASEIIEFEYSP